MKLVAACAGKATAAEQCVQADLQRVLRADGQKAAFALLFHVAQTPAYQGRDHGLAHHLGRFAYEVVNDPAKALADCPLTMGSGCAHGVVEGYFQAKGSSANVTRLCQGTGSGAAQATHQCWHGVGHGLMMANDYNWAAAVKPCAAIAQFMDRVNCSSGVFMENFMSDTATNMEMAGMEGMHHSAPRTPRLHPDDLLYPCNKAVEEHVKIGCWQMQPFAVRKLTGSFEKAFETCARSGQYVVMCDEGIGQAAAAQARTDGTDPLTYCSGAGGDKTAWSRCMIGAVKDVIMNAHSITPGLAVCASATFAYALDCYGAVGVMHAGFEASPDVRWVSCAAVVAVYRYACAAVATPKAGPLRGD